MRISAKIAFLIGEKLEKKRQILKSTNLLGIKTEAKSLYRKFNTGINIVQFYIYKLELKKYIYINSY